MNKKICFASIIALYGVLCVPLAQAVPIIQVQPATQSATVGDTASVDVIVSGLTDEWIGSYDLAIDWDASLLGFLALTFDIFLDGPADSLQGFTAGAGSVNAFEVSLSSLANQTGNGSFRLFTLTFDTLGTGTSGLTFAQGGTQLLGNELGDGYAEFGLTGASITVNARATSVPEPGTLALLGLGLAGLSLSRRRMA